MIKVTTILAWLLKIPPLSWGNRYLMMRAGNSRVYVTASLLGWAGVIPFLFFAVAMWVVPLGQLEIQKLLISLYERYAAIVLCFQSAIYWGIAIGRSVYINDDRQKQLYQVFGFSVLPALIGWLTHLLPIHLNLTIMALCYGIVLLVDRQALAWDILPFWYFSLRRRLTTVVVFTMLMVAIRLV